MVRDFVADDAFGVGQRIGAAHHDAVFLHADREAAGIGAVKRATASRSIIGISSSV
jgi:hypothetical protein